MGKLTQTRAPDALSPGKVSDARRTEAGRFDPRMPACYGNKW